MFDAVCVGILVADVISKPVDEIPSKGKLGAVDKIELHTGGCATSCCIDLAKIGLSTAIIGKVGNDGFGSFMNDSLVKEGVNTEGLVFDNSVGTSASVVLSASDGERTFLHSFGANGVFSYDDINFDIIDKTNLVFVAGTMLMPTFDGEHCARFLKKVKQMGKTTMLDTAWDSKGRWMKLLKPSMEYLDIFIPSYDEAVMLSNKKDPNDIADVFIGMGVKTAVIKMGIDGCFIKSSSGEKYTIPTYRHIKAVDTTGAGDSFVAGFITGIVKGFNLEECGVFANATGTHCVMAIGASTGIKSFDEIMNFIKDNAPLLQK